MATNENVIEGAADTERPSHRRGAHRRSSRERKRLSQLVVAALAVAAGIGGAAAGCHPTGTPIVDPVYTGFLAAGVTVAASKARRSAWLVLTAAAMALSRGLLLAPAAAGLVLAFASTFSKRRRQRVGALVGALAIQVILRWPSVGFQGLTALVAAVAVGWCAASALRNTSRRSRRLVLRAGLGAAGVLVLLSIPAVLGALWARSPVEGAIANTAGALSAVTSGGTSAGLAKLASASAQLRTAHSRAGSWWSAGARLVPIVAQQRQAIAGATGAAADLTASARKEASVVDIHKLGYTDGHFDIARIRAAGPPLEALNSQVTSAQATLRSLHSGWLVPPIAKRLDSFGGQLAKAGHDVSLGAEVVKAAPGLLGGDGVRHYFVAFMTPAEARGLGGLIGAYAILSFDQGRVTLTDSGPYGELDASLPPSGAKLTGLSDYQHRYGMFHPARHFEDLTYSPDFPTVARAISEMVPQAGKGHIDGVLALDTHSLAAILNFTGPLAIPGLPQPLTASNAATILDRTQYELFASSEKIDRHSFLQGALQLAFSALLHTHSVNPELIARTLDSEVRQGRVLFWSSHPLQEAFISPLAISGAFPQEGQGDLLAVTTQNAANNKLDAYLHTSIADHITEKPLPRGLGGALRITLYNAAPPSGLPPYVLGSYPGSGLTTGTNKTWLSVYTPLAFTGATQDGKAVSMTSSQEFAVHVYSAYITIPPLSSVTLMIHLQGTQPLQRPYTITIVRQPTAVPSSETVSFTPEASANTSKGSSDYWIVPSSRLSHHAFPEPTNR